MKQKDVKIMAQDLLTAVKTFKTSGQLYTFFECKTDDGVEKMLVQRGHKNTYVVTPISHFLVYLQRQVHGVFQFRCINVMVTRRGVDLSFAPAPEKFSQFDYPICSSFIVVENEVGELSLYSTMCNSRTEDGYIHYNTFVVEATSVSELENCIDVLDLHRVINVFRETGKTIAFYPISTHGGATVSFALVQSAQNKDDVFVLPVGELKYNFNVKLTRDPEFGISVGRKPVFVMKEGNMEYAFEYDRENKVVSLANAVAEEVPIGHLAKIEYFFLRFNVLSDKCIMLTQMPYKYMANNLSIHRWRVPKEYICSEEVKKPKLTEVRVSPDSLVHTLFGFVNRGIAMASVEKIRVSNTDNETAEEDFLFIKGSHESNEYASAYLRPIASLEGIAAERVRQNKPKGKYVVFGIYVGDFSGFGVFDTERNVFCDFRCMEATEVFSCFSESDFYEIDIARLSGQTIQVMKYPTGVPEFAPFKDFTFITDNFNKQIDRSDIAWMPDLVLHYKEKSKKTSDSADVKLDALEKAVSTLEQRVSVMERRTNFGKN